MKKSHLDFRTQLISAMAFIAVAQTLLIIDGTAEAAPAKAPKANVKTAAPAPALSIRTYLDQVAQGNDGYKSAEMSRRAAENYSGESSLLLAPTFIANAKVDSDGKPSPFPIPGFNYSSLDTTMYQAGISKQFAMGLRTALTYTATSTDYVGLPSAEKYYEARPQIEAVLPLWKNFWGRETIGNVDAGRLAALAKAQSQSSLAKSVLVDAEAAYWRLALAREALKVSEDSVLRARAMFDWTSRRERLALADRSEHLQSTAQIKARELDYKSAQDEERSARLTFNSARGVNSDKVDETLEVLNANLIEKWEMPSRTQSRPDVEAARLQAEAAEAKARASGESSKPTVEVYGMYAFNSPHRSAQSDALADSWRRDRPSTEYGVRMSMPLDFSTMKRTQEGWAAEANASRTLIARKLFEQERDWNDVVARFQLAKEKIRLYEELESSQRSKLEYERSRQKAGRSTVAQVILFETDYEQTQFSRIRSLADVLNLNAQMKLYGVAYEAAKTPDSGAAQ